MYLIIDGCNDSCPYPHTGETDSMKVLVKEERKYQSIYEEHDRVEVAMPVGLRLILSKLYHQPITNHRFNKLIKARPI